MQQSAEKERTTPLTNSQIQFYTTNGYLVIEEGCSHDLIDAYNDHIYTIRSADPIPEWAAPRAGGTVDQRARFSVRLFNPHLHDGFSLQMMKLPIIRGGLAQLLGDEAVGVQACTFTKNPGHWDRRLIRTIFIFVMNRTH